jgi:hypothetical protein
LQLVEARRKPLGALDPIMAFLLCQRAFLPFKKRSIY